jgi:phytoene dehydrogenase-like protein
MFRLADLHAPGVSLPYDLTERELWEIKAPTAQTPAELIGWAVQQEFPETKEMPPEKLRHFLQTAKIDGKPLYQWGFWNLIARHLSNEGRQLALTTVGYDSLGANANAVDIIAENFDFTPGVTYTLFDEGFESVIWKLADEFRAMGGTIATGMTLEGFQTSAASGPPIYDLDFEQRVGVKSPQAVTARAVVLALPQAALQNLRKVGPVFGPQAPQVPMLLNSVSSIPLYKLFLIYDRPWWQ